jgi:hypothetical protein
MAYFQTAKIIMTYFHLTLELRFESAKVVKGQIIADFITEHRGSSINLLEITPWVLFFDGSSCGKGGGVGILLISPRGKCLNLLFLFNLLSQITKLSMKHCLEGFNT